MGKESVHNSAEGEILLLTDEAEQPNTDRGEYERFVEALRQPGMREKVISILIKDGLLPASLWKQP